jgi:excisionase family DNA binding protein
MTAVRVKEQERAPFFTLKGLAAYLNMSERKVRYLLASGEIPSYRLSGCLRVIPEDVDAWVASNRDTRR